MKEQLGKAAKAKLDPTNRLTSKTYMEQLKHTNQKKRSGASHCFYNRYTVL